MARSRFNRARIRGVVCSVPPGERSIDDEVELFGGDRKQIERIKKTIGLDRRRVVDPGVTAADLCRHAAESLIADTGLDRSQVDALICVTQTPDHAQPCNAALLQARLGLGKHCAALDVNLGCSGYVYGLWLAYMMVECGGCDRVLLLAGDTISRVVNPRDRSVAPLFGDGGSATLVCAVDDAPAAWFSLNTDGGGSGHLIVPAGGFRRPADAGTAAEAVDEAGNYRCAENLFMDGGEVFTFSGTEEPPAIRELVEFAGTRLEAVDHFVFHQANRFILGNITKRLGVPPEKVPAATVEQFGNQSSASIPNALCFELAEQLTTGAERTVVLSGFGVGLSWASLLTRVGGLAACRLVDYQAGD